MDNVKWLDTRFCIKRTPLMKSALLAAGQDIFKLDIYRYLWRSNSDK